MSNTTAYRQCGRIGRGVSVKQTEGQCRDQHNCNDDACPLEGEFGKDRFGNAVNNLAAQIGQAFAKAAD